MFEILGFKFKIYSVAPVAQRIEHWFPKPGVGCSSHLRGTTIFELKLAVIRPIICCPFIRMIILTILIVIGFCHIQKNQEWDF